MVASRIDQPTSAFYPKSHAARTILICSEGVKLVLFLFSPADVRGFGKLSRISLFNITSNRRRRISHSLVQSLAKFTLLKTLDLGDNNLEGATLAQGELQYVLMSYLAMEI